MRALHRTAPRRVAAALTAGALLALTACGAGGGNEEGQGDYNDAVHKVHHASDTRGGTLRYVGIQDADSWDPTRTYTGFVFNFARYYSRQLVSYANAPGRKGISLRGDLAEDTAHLSDDGRTYTYTLRKGVRWEDGKPVTAADVKYGIERQWAQNVLSGGPVYLKELLDPDGKYGGPYRDPEGLDAIETPDERTVVFHLPHRNGDFERILAMSTNSPVRKDKDAKAKYGLHPFSNGPYVFEAYEPNKSLTLKRNPHWKPATDPLRKALPDRIEVTLLTNPDERDNRLLHGDADLDLNQRGLDAQARQRAFTDERGNLDVTQTGNIAYAALPQSVPPFDDVHCRRAVLRAADLKSLQTARGGPAAGGAIGINMLPPVVPGHDPHYDPYGLAKHGGKPQLTAARKELRRCGRPQGFRTHLAVRNNEPADLKQAESLQASLGKVGIDVEVETFDGTQGSSIIGNPDTVERKKYGIIVLGWGPDFASAQGYGLPLWHSDSILDNGNNNFALVDDEKIDALFAKAIAELDEEQAAQTYARINKRVMQGAYYLPMTYIRAVLWRSDRLTNAYTTDGFGGQYDFASLGVR